MSLYFLFFIFRCSFFVVLYQYTSRRALCVFISGGCVTRQKHLSCVVSFWFAFDSQFNRQTVNVYTWKEKIIKFHLDFWKSTANSHLHTFPVPISAAHEAEKKKQQKQPEEKNGNFLSHFFFSFGKTATERKASRALCDFAIENT